MRESVLFLCTGNSARSQMAEAILRDKAGERFDVSSAGTEPKPIHAMTLRVLDEAGIDAAGLASTNVRDVLGKRAITHAVVVCEEANRNCPRIYPFSYSMEFWPFDDPAAFVGTEDEVLAKFREVRDAIAERIDRWLATIDSGSARRQSP